MNQSTYVYDTTDFFQCCDNPYNYVLCSALLISVDTANFPVVIIILVIVIVLAVVLVAIARVKGMLCFAGNSPPPLWECISACCLSI